MSLMRPTYLLFYSRENSRVVVSDTLPVLLLLRYILLPMQMQIRFQYRSSMLLVFGYHSNQIAISHLRHILHDQ